MTPDASMQHSLAVIGCGAVVEQFYLPGLQHLAKLGWSLHFVDSSAAQARALASQFPGAATEATIDEVLGKVSHAIVATPPASHAAICGQLIDAGIHVLCEKPFVLDPAEGQELEARARRAGVKLQVNQTRRWFPASRRARELVSSGAIGDVQSVRLREGGRFNWPAKTAFHSQPGLARVGILSDLGAHAFDLIGWILGRPLSAVRVDHDGYAGPETTINVHFVSGNARGEVVMTWLVPVPPRLEFIGSSGSITIDDDCNRTILRRGDALEEIAEECRYTSYEAISQDLLGAFVDDSTHPSVATAASVLPSIEFLDCAYRIGAPRLPLVTAIGGGVQ